MATGSRWNYRICKWDQRSSLWHPVEDRASEATGGGENRQVTSSSCGACRVLPCTCVNHHDVKATRSRWLGPTRSRQTGGRAAVMILA